MDGKKNATSRTGIEKAYIVVVRQNPIFFSKMIYASIF